MRSFVALPLPEPVLDRLEALQSAIPVGRIVPRENLHLTLAFLDEVDESTLAELHGALSVIRARPVPLEIAGLDLLGGSRSQILFAGVRVDAALDTLQGRVARAARSVAITLPRRRFRPHVTLARLNRAPNALEAARLGAFLQAHSLDLAIDCEATRFCLYRSDLGHGPARYDELASYSLGAGAQG